MNTKKTLVALIAAAALGLSACTTTPTADQNSAMDNQAAGTDTVNTNDTGTMDNTNSMDTTTTPTATSSTGVMATTTPAKKPTGPVKEFTMTSFFEMKDGKPAPQFSVKDLSVKKGDTVRIKVTNIKGMHNFNIDEFNVHEATPLNQEVTIEFTADKTGDFVYYCSMPGHRANGHWGTLHVK